MTATVTVPADQLPLAIGRDGQNAKLAGKLTGYHIDIVPEKGTSEKKEIVKNFDQCILWYNSWVDKNQFGNKYSVEALNDISDQEEQRLQLPIVQRNLLQ